LRALLGEHSGASLVLATSLLVLHSGGPKKAEEIEDTNGASIGGTTLTDFTRKCLRLWRQVYGARLGVYNVKGAEKTKLKNKMKKTWAACHRSVVKAARRACNAASRPGNEMTAFGVERSSLIAEGVAKPKESLPYWGQRMGNFAALTNAKRVFNSKTHLGRTLVKQVSTAPRRAKAPIPELPVISKIYFSPADDTDSALGGEVVLGRGHARRAHLVVIDCLSRLFSLNEGNEKELADLVAIVGLGLPVVKREDWLAAGCKAWQVRDESIVFHQRLVGKQKVTFKIPETFGTTHPRTSEALKACFAVEGSLWRREGPRAVSAGVEIVDVADVTAFGRWLAASRKIVNCSVMRAVPAASRT